MKEGSGEGKVSVLVSYSLEDFFGGEVPIDFLLVTKM